MLVRNRETKPKFDLKILERYDNVKNAFSINEKYKNKNLKDLNICLVDDVLTTGSTIIECAKVLRQAGASKIYAICLARGN